MKLRKDKMEKFISDHGWKNTYVAEQLGLTNEHFSRIKANTQSMGNKSIRGLVHLLRYESTTIPQFLELENATDLKRLVNILKECRFYEVIPLVGG